MATADAEEELSNVFSWSLAMVGSVIASLFVLGLFISAAALPAIILTPLVEPATAPFIWFTVIGLTLAVMGQSMDDSTVDIMEDFLTDFNEKSPREQKVYVASFFLLLMGSVSFLVGSVALVAESIVVDAGTAAISISLAFLYPYIDSWLGQRTGWNLATVGGIIALVALEGFAIAYQVSPRIPRDVASNLRTSLNRRKAAP